MRYHVSLVALGLVASCCRGDLAQVILDRDSPGKSLDLSAIASSNSDGLPSSEATAHLRPELASKLTRPAARVLLPDISALSP